MLEGAARSYYLAKVKGKCHTFEEAVALIRKRFITPERSRALVQEWEKMSLSEFLKPDPTKPKQCLEKIIDRMNNIQTLLPEPYHSDVIYRNKLLNAVSMIDCCRLACQKPSLLVEGVIADLFSSIATHNRSTDGGSITEMLVDRKYHKNRIAEKKCFVCHKRGCWSSNHSELERLTALKKNSCVRQF